MPVMYVMLHNFIPGLWHSFCDWNEGHQWKLFVRVWNTSDFFSLNMFKYLTNLDHLCHRYKVTGCWGLRIAPFEPAAWQRHGSAPKPELLVVLCLPSLLNWRELTPEYFSKHASPEIIDKPWNILKSEAWPNCSRNDSWMMLDQSWSMTQSILFSTPQHQFNAQDTQCRECSKAHTSYAAGCMTVCGPFLQVQRPLLPQLTHTAKHWLTLHTLHTLHDPVPSFCLVKSIHSKRRCNNDGMKH